MSATIEQGRDAFTMKPVNLPVFEPAVTVFVAADLAELAVFSAFDTALDFVDSAPATALEASTVAAETAEEAVFRPAAAAEFAADGQLATDGRVT